MELETRKSLAKKLKVSVSTIRRWESIGMPSIHIGAVIRYEMAKVSQWVTLNNFVKDIVK